MTNFDYVDPLQEYLRLTKILRADHVDEDSIREEIKRAWDAMPMEQREEVRGLIPPM